MRFPAVRWEELNLTAKFVESLLLSLLFTLPIYLFADGISTHTESLLQLLFLALLTLFEGTFSGLVALVTISGALYFMTLSFDARTILEELIFILLFGEFRYHWERKYTRNEEEKRYLKQKFRELSNAFFALKVSHDQLEKGYLLKPVTLRSLIIELSTLSQERTRIQTLFETFKEAFSLQGALYCRLSPEGALLEQTPLGESKAAFDPRHPMVSEALQTKKAVFLAQSELAQMEREPLMAVLPILDNNDEVIALFMIEKIDFLAFNMDNILKLQILLEYFEQERLQHTTLERFTHKALLADMDAKFYFEIERLSTMRRRYGIHSAIVILATSDPAIALLMENFRTKKMRLLDMVDVIHKDQERFYLFLLPLERVSGAISFKERLLSQLSSFDAQSYRVLVAEIEQISQITTWIAQEERR